MPSREFSTASFCTSRIFATPFRLKSPPTSPCSIFLATSLLFAWPVVISPVTGRFSCPIFSSTVIFFISASMNRSMSCGDFCACILVLPIRMAASNRLVLLKTFFMICFVRVFIKFRKLMVIPYISMLLSLTCESLICS